MKKRWVILAAIVLTIVILPHTPIVERSLLNRTIKALRELGIDLEAKELQLNLFRLSVRLTSVQISGQGWAADCGHVSINLGRGVLTGRIDVDEIVLRSGQLRLDDALFEANNKESTSLQIPNIRLGRLQVDDFSFGAQGKVVETSVTADDLSILRDNAHLIFRAAADKVKLANLELAEVSIALDLDTDDFSNFTNIQLTTQTAQSQISIAGDADLREREFQLRITSSVGPDLFDYPEPVNFNMVVENEMGHWRALSKVVAMDQTWPLEAHGEAQLSMTPQTDVQFRLGDIAVGEGWVEWDGTSLKTSYQVEIDALKLEPRIEQAGISDLLLHGTFQMSDDWELVAKVQGNGRAKLNASAFMTSAGSRLVNLNYGYQDVSAVGWFDQNNEGFVDIRLGSDLFLRPWLGDQVQFDRAELGLEAKWADGSAKIQRSSGLIRHLVIQNEDLGDVRVRAAGDLKALAFEAYTENKQIDLEGVVDLLQMELTDGCLSLSSFVVNQSPIPAVFDANVRIRGPFNQLEVGGMLAAEFNAGGLEGYAVTSLEMSKQVLYGRHVDIRYGPVRVIGHGSFASLDQWSAEGVLHSQHGDLMLDSGPIGLPIVDLAFRANANEVSADVNLIDQQIAVGEHVINLGGDVTIPIRVALKEPLALDVNQPFDVAGISVYGLHVEMTGDETQIEADLMLNSWSKTLASLAIEIPSELDLFQSSISLSVSLPANRAPEICVSYGELNGAWDGQPITLSDINASYQDDLNVETLRANTAGLKLNCFAGPATRDWPKPSPRFGSDELDCHCTVDLTDEIALNETLAYWELPLKANKLAAEIELVSDLSFTRPRFALWLDEFKGSYEASSVTVDQLAVAYDGQWHANDGLILFDKLPISLAVEADGLHVRSVLGVTQLQEFAPELLGDALFWIDVRVPPLDQQDHLQAEFRQLVGSLFHPEPWMEIQGAYLQLEKKGPDFRLQDSKVEVNGALVALSGAGSFRDDQLNWHVSAYGESVPLTYGDFFGLTDLAIMVQKPNQGRAVLRGEVSTRDGYYTPSQSLESFIRDMIEETPAIYFPDPVLDSVDLQLLVKTASPLIVEHDLGFVIMESPDLMILGTLASPDLTSGTIFINEGSEINVGRETYVFRESQIQFHANRPGEPYLQVFLEYGEFDDRQPIQLLGYMSDLEGDTSSDGLTDLVASYLLGHVTSAVSLESEQNEQIFDRSFSIVFTQPLHDKLISRVAVPIDDPSRQRIELGVGPYFESYASAVYEENTLTYDVRRRQKLGLPAHQPPRIEKIQWLAEVTREIKRKLGIRKGDVFSETYLRRARLRLNRHFIKHGYLNANVDITFDDGIMDVSVKPGPKTEIIIDGLVLEKKQLPEMYRIVKQSGDAASRRLQLWMEQTAIRTGFRSAQVEVMQSGHLWRVKVTTGEPVGRIDIQFGDANKLLASLVEKQERAKTFLVEYLVAPSRSEALLRARLAAQGYVQPKIERGRFTGPLKYEIPISLGPKALLKEIIPGEGSEPLPKGITERWSGQSFSYDNLKSLTEQLDSARRRDQRVSVAPRQVESDVVIEIKISTTAESVFRDLSIEGDDRIDKKKLSRFFRPKNGLFTQSSLIKSQEELIKTGSYRAVRIMSEQESAHIVLEERNRWDFEYGLAINEYEEPTLVAQFRDNMFGSRVNTFSVRGERGPTQRSVSAQALFRRILNSPFNFYLLGGWDRSTRDDNPDEFQPPLQIEIQRRFVFPESYTASSEIRYPISQRSELTLGAEYKRIIQHEQVIFFFEPFDYVEGQPLDANDITEIVNSTSNIDLTPLKFSWSYRDLDNKSNPRSGFLLRFGLEHYIQVLGSENAVNGTRVNGAWTLFKSGRRWLWQQRYKLGFYRPKNSIPDAFSDQRDPLLFYLGGPTTLRGYSQDSLGPFSGDGERIVGGEAMLFASHELAYDIGWQDLSISGFVDAGRVWKDYDNVDFSKISVSTGVGLGWDSAIGHLQFDWAFRVQEYLPDDLVLKATKDWHFRYGRTF